MKGFLAIAFVLVMVSVVFPASAAEENADVDLSVAGVRVISGVYKDGDQQIVAFMGQEGTSVAFLVTSEKGGMVEFKQDASKLLELKDDKGTDLLKVEKKPNSWARPGFSGWPRISSDGKVLLVEVFTPGVPAEGATQLTVKGTIVVSVSAGTEEHENKNIDLALDTKVEAGDEDLVITAVGKPDWGDFERSVKFKGTGSASRIKEIKFYDADGKEIETKKGSILTSGYGDKVSFAIEIQTKEKINKATVKVIAWKDLKDVEIPLSVKTGVGLGK